MKIRINATATAITLFLGAALSGCSTLTPTQQTQEAYVVIDGVGSTTAASIDRLTDEITTAVKKHVSSAQVTRTAPPVQLPKEPGRFSIADITRTTPMIAPFAQATGHSWRTGLCENPVLVLKANDTSLSRFGQEASYFVCVMPYAKGYRTAVYASYRRAGGIGVLGTEIVGPLVGDLRQFIPRMMAEVKQSMVKNLREVKVVQSYIPEDFAGPMVDVRRDLEVTQAN